MELLLIRHGSAETNGCIAGHLDYPISIEGIYQSQLLGDYLKCSRIKFLYTSPLSRALSTAQIIGDKIGISPIIINELKERSAGIFEGLTREECSLKYPSYWRRTWSNPLVAPQNGESYEDVVNRLKKIICILQNNKNEKVAFVSHSGLLNIFINFLLDLSPNVFPLFKLNNTSITSLSSNSSWKFTINYINKIDHLNIA